jgi:hypothetical protein
MHRLFVMSLASALTVSACAAPPAAIAEPPRSSQSSEPSSPSPNTAKPTAESVRIVRPFEGITVHLSEAGESFIEVEARTCLDRGLLEQIACAPNSREHESLVVVKPRPSQIHAALLMAGFKAGSPGKWIYEDEKLRTVNPTGDALSVHVRYTNAAGEVVEHPIRQWIRAATFDADGQKIEKPPVAFPDHPWVFAGSRIAPNPPFMGEGEHYVADMTGSIIGLVTFGDEVIGFSRVMSDQQDVQPLEWEANTEAMPPADTPVVIVLKKFERAGE